MNLMWLEEGLGVCRDTVERYSQASGSGLVSRADHLNEGGGSPRQQRAWARGVG